MLDQKCYDRMVDTFYTELATDPDNNRLCMLSKMVLHAMEDVLEEHEHATYWDGFEKQAMDQHLVNGLVMVNVVNVYKGVFHAFEKYVEEQLVKE